MSSARTWAYVAVESTLVTIKGQTRKLREKWQRQSCNWGKQRFNSISCTFHFQRVYRTSIHTSCIFLPKFRGCIVFCWHKRHRKEMSYPESSSIGTFKTYRPAVTLGYCCFPNFLFLRNVSQIMIKMSIPGKGRDIAWKDISAIKSTRETLEMMLKTLLFGRAWRDHSWINGHNGNPKIVHSTAFLVTISWPTISADLVGYL